MIIIFTAIGMVGSVDAANKNTLNKGHLSTPTSTVKMTQGRNGKNAEQLNKGGKQTTVVGTVKSQTAEQMVVTVEKKLKNKSVSTTDVTVTFPTTTPKMAQSLNKKLNFKTHNTSSATSTVGYFNRQISIGDKVWINGKKQADGTVLSVNIKKIEHCYFTDIHSFNYFLTTDC